MYVPHACKGKINARLYMPVLLTNIILEIRINGILVNILWIYDYVNTQYISPYSSSPVQLAPGLLDFVTINGDTVISQGPLPPPFDVSLPAGGSLDFALTINSINPMHRGAAFRVIAGESHVSKGYWNIALNWWINGALSSFSDVPCKESWYRITMLSIRTSDRALKKRFCTKKNE